MFSLNISKRNDFTSIPISKTILEDDYYNEKLSNNKKKLIFTVNLLVKN